MFEQDKRNRKRRLNRITAQRKRVRQKAELDHLRESQNELTTANKGLNAENEALRDTIDLLRKQQELRRQPNGEQQAQMMNQEILESERVLMQAMSDRTGEPPPPLFPMTSSQSAPVAQAAQQGGLQQQQQPGAAATAPMPTLSWNPSMQVPQAPSAMLPSINAGANVAFPAMLMAAIMQGGALLIPQLLGQLQMPQQQRTTSQQQQAGSISQAVQSTQQQLYAASTTSQGSVDQGGSSAHQQAPTTTQTSPVPQQHQPVQPPQGQQAPAANQQSAPMAQQPAMGQEQQQLNPMAMLAQMLQQQAPTIAGTNQHSTTSTAPSQAQPQPQTQLVVPSSAPNQDQLSQLLGPLMSLLQQQQGQPSQPYQVQQVMASPQSTGALGGTVQHQQPAFATALAVHRPIHFAPTLTEGGLRCARKPQPRRKKRP